MHTSHMMRLTLTMMKEWVLATVLWQVHGTLTDSTHGGREVRLFLSRWSSELFGAPSSASKVLPAKRKVTLTEDLLSKVSWSPLASSRT